MIIQDFEDRVEDVEIYFSFANEIDHIETHKKKIFELADNSKLTIKRDLQKVIRANCYLILYNLIESTIRNGLWYIYDTIVDEKIPLEKLSDNLKQIWLSQKASEMMELNNQNKVKEKIKDLINDQINGETIHISKARLTLSGNLDYRSIEKLIKDYAIFGTITVADKKGLGKALLKIKSERNALAHGNKSFRKSAELTTIQELNNYKNLTVQYLGDITKNISSYIENGRYTKN